MELKNKNLPKIEKEKKERENCDKNKQFKEEKKFSKQRKQIQGKKKFPATANDPNWYLIKNLTSQEVASYPWNTMAGFTMEEITNKDVFADTATKTDAALPGIMVLKVASTFPYSTGTNSALNRASLGLFADILTKNSSNVPFEHTDLTMSMFALADIDAIIAAGMRVYGLIHSYPIKNRYMAQNLIRACGFDYESLIADPYAFLARLNVYISRRNRFYIPKNFNWRSREVWLSTNIYKDSDDPKCQYYVIKKDSYSVWSPRTSESGSELRQHSISFDFGTTITVDQYFEILEEMLTPLEIDQDIYIMQGYLLKRYDTSEFISMPKLGSDFILEPVIDYTVMTMIQNAKVYQLQLSGTEYYPLSQSNGQFIYNPSLKVNAAFADNVLLTSCFNNPTPDETIECTRWVYSGTYDPVTDLEYKASVGTIAKIEPSALCGDIVVGIIIYGMQANGNPRVRQFDVNSWGVNATEVETDLNVLYLATNIGIFDFHPLLPVQHQVDANTTPTFRGIIGDFDNTMILTPENITKLQDVLSFGLVNVVDPK